jgi:hypothetical protein
MMAYQVLGNAQLLLTIPLRERIVSPDFMKALTNVKDIDSEQIPMAPHGIIHTTLLNMLEDSLAL